MGQSYDHVKFTSIWQDAATTEEVAHKTGLTIKQCAAKAAYLRRKKVDLKNMPKGRPENKAVLDECRKIVNKTAAADMVAE